MTNDALLNYAQHHGHEVFYADLQDTTSITIEKNGCYIALSKHMTSVEEKECLAHELGHCEYGGFYNRYSKHDIRAKTERRADKWAYRKLVPPREVKEAFQRGIVEPWDLADIFEVSCEYMQRVLSYYRQVAII